MVASLHLHVLAKRASDSSATCYQNRETETRVVEKSFYKPLRFAYEIEPEEWQEGETSFAFCVIQNNVQIHQWTAKLRPHNTVFQAETLAIKEAINWANFKGLSTSIWSDSESAVRVISSFKSSNPLIQKTQQALLQNPSVQLKWIKAHVGFLGNEAAGNLAKQATKEGTHLHLQAPKCHLKKMLMNLSLNKWQQDWDSGDTGRAIFNILPNVILTPASWSRESILFATGHGSFPSCLYRFRLHHSEICTCGEKGNPLHYATSCHMTLSYILQKQVQKTLNFGGKVFFQINYQE
ncbi:hypothetical protein AVEN_126193-1 [Araneus ventricosus]|uniref:RNase H type-1 domain-containing protein n=1 Tax=Araneus ventricosus TaxID=182803 RepID=A0A4Y2LCL7_ARAVE|nr:hypothetical protein AVEN_126193-1 [Araneus ventricosus]